MSETAPLSDDIVTLPASQVALDDIAHKKDPAERKLYRRALAVLRYAEGECNCMPAIQQKLLNVRRLMDKLMTINGDMGSDFELGGYEEIIADDDGLRQIDELEALIWEERSKTPPSDLEKAPAPRPTKMSLQAMAAQLDEAA